MKRDQPKKTHFFCGPRLTKIGLLKCQLSYTDKSIVNKLWPVLVWLRLGLVATPKISVVLILVLIVVIVVIDLVFRIVDRAQKLLAKLVYDVYEYQEDQ